MNIKTRKRLITEGTSLLPAACPVKKIPLLQKKKRDIIFKKELVPGWKNPLHSNNKIQSKIGLNYTERLTATGTTNGQG
jgi:hypothetical protein